MCLCAHQASGAQIEKMLKEKPDNKLLTGKREKKDTKQSCSRNTVTYFRMYMNNKAYEIVNRTE